jgi:NAD/NADP transhydrogenase beta subunit
MTKVHQFELFVGCFVGAITFTASVFAYGKLAAKKWAKTLKGAGLSLFKQHCLRHVSVWAVIILPLAI